jgi:hypothetical protein
MIQVKYDFDPVKLTYGFAVALCLLKTYVLFQTFFSVLILGSRLVQWYRSVAQNQEIADVIPARSSNILEVKIIKPILIISQ